MANRTAPNYQTTTNLSLVREVLLLFCDGIIVSCLLFHLAKEYKLECIVAGGTKLEMLWRTVMKF